MKAKKLIQAAFLLIIMVTMCGCRSAEAEGKNVKKTEFRISSVPSGRFVTKADTSRSGRNSVHDRICENWHKDLILGRGVELCGEPSK